MPGIEADRAGSNEMIATVAVLDKRKPLRVQNAGNMAVIGFAAHLSVIGIGVTVYIRKSKTVGSWLGFAAVGIALLVGGTGPGAEVSVTGTVDVHFSLVCRQPAFVCYKNRADLFILKLYSAEHRLKQGNHPRIGDKPVIDPFKQLRINSDPLEHILRHMGNIPAGKLKDLFRYALIQYPLTVGDRTPRRNQAGCPHTSESSARFNQQNPGTPAGSGSRGSTARWSAATDDYLEVAIYFTLRNSDIIFHHMLLLMYLRFLFDKTHLHQMLYFIIEERKDIAC